MQTIHYQPLTRSIAVSLPSKKPKLHPKVQRGTVLLVHSHDKQTICLFVPLYIKLKCSPACNVLLHGGGTSEGFFLPKLPNLFPDFSLDEHCCRPSFTCAKTPMQGFMWAALYLSSIYPQLLKGKSCFDILPVGVQPDMALTFVDTFHDMNST